MLFLDVQRVLVAVLIAACGTAGGSDATSKDVIRVHRGGQISAKRMVGGNGAHGPQVVTSLQGEGVGSVQLMVP